MQISFIGIVFILQGLLLLLLGAGFLILHNRKLARLIVKLKERLAQLTHSATSQDDTEQEGLQTTSSKTYSQYIDEQLELTRQYHSNLSSDQDISLDLGLDNPLPRQVVALRHALLTCEKQAVISGDTKKPNWMILQDKLSDLISFYTSNISQNDLNDDDDATDDTDDTKIEQLKKRVSNLEKFKKLYFDLEKRWEATQKQASECYNNLTEFAETTDDDELTSLINRYQESYNDFNNTVSNNTAENKTSVIEVVRPDPKANTQVKQLRSIAIDQQRKITELKEKLNNSGTDQSLADELQEQLASQNQFIKESESCIELLENELQRAFDELDTLQEALKESQQQQVTQFEQQAHKETAVEQYAKDNQRLQIVVDELEKTIKALQKENDKQLKTINGSGANNDPSESAEFTNLQQQYNELEEKYLELKMSQ